MTLIELEALRSALFQWRTLLLRRTTLSAWNLIVRHGCVLQAALDGSECP